MGSRKIDLTGKRFGLLTVIRDVGRRIKAGSILWECLCDCGNTSVVPADSLRWKETQSCGCVRDRKAKERALPCGEGNVFRFFDGTVISRITSKKPYKRNSSGVRGVYKVKSAKGDRWVATLTLRYKRTHLGTFDTIEEAREVREKAEEKYFAPVIERYYEAHQPSQEEGGVIQC